MAEPSLRHLWLVAASHLTKAVYHTAKRVMAYTDPPGPATSATVEVERNPVAAGPPRQKDE